MDSIRPNGGSDKKKGPSIYEVRARDPRHNKDNKNNNMVSCLV